MYIVEVYKDHELSFSVPFQSESLTIGRATTCDICLPDSNISRVHALIQMKNRNLTLVDKSTHGTILNGTSTPRSEFIPGDEISIGKWKIKVKSAANQNADITLTEKRKESTALLSYHEKNHELTLTESKLVQIKPIKREFKITKNIFSLGKNNINDVIIEDEFISGFHCKIDFRNHRFFLKDLQSTNGTILNGQKVVEAELNDRSTIEIGRAQFEFFVRQENKKINTNIQENFFHGIVSQNPKMKEVFGLIDSLKDIASPIFIHGETGTGKELVARAIHDTSTRAGKRFITVNCGAIAKELIESELFGHEKGSFTGAATQREGLFEQADQGTIFLDEIGELPLELQPKLLRVLETGEIRRVGSSKNQQVNVRIITATHRNLPEEIQLGRFREDLFYRIYVLAINLPALRERMDDMNLLVEHFLNQAKSHFGQGSKKQLNAEAMQKLISHTWPGNVRELKNVIDRAIALSRTSDEIKSEHIMFASPIAGKAIPIASPTISTNTATPSKEPQSLEEMEKQMIYSALEKNNWNKKATAAKLGIAKSTLHEKIKRYGIVGETGAEDVD